VCRGSIVAAAARWTEILSMGHGYLALDVPLNEQRRTLVAMPGRLRQALRLIPGWPGVAVRSWWAAGFDHPPRAVCR
jgi:hypothetical protein